MPSELETAIEEYAKREAERFFHTTNPQFLPNSITETRRRDYASGILHLAEQFQREDVIDDDYPFWVDLDSGTTIHVSYFEIEGDHA